MTYRADPDQLASSEANCSGSTLFAKTEHVVFSKRRVNMCFTLLLVTALTVPDKAISGNNFRIISIFELKTCEKLERIFQKTKTLW